MKLLLGIKLLFLVQSVNNENIGQFLNKFYRNKNFQISRIKFPVKNKIYDLENDKFIHKNITKTEWEFQNFNQKKFLKKTYTSIQKFTLKIQIEDTGVLVEYIFRLYGNKWFLTEIIDKST